MHKQQFETHDLEQNKNSISESCSSFVKGGTLVVKYYSSLAFIQCSFESASFGCGLKKKEEGIVLYMHVAHMVRTADRNDVVVDG